MKIEMITIISTFITTSCRALAFRDVVSEVKSSAANLAPPPAKMPAANDKGGRHITRPHSQF